MYSLSRFNVILIVFIYAILLLPISSCAATSQIDQVTVSSSAPEPFYAGVTYCGDSVAEAKQLIDKVKNYTNLFVLQSGSLQFELDKMNQICDYAVASDLSFIVYFGIQYPNLCNDWLETFDHRWDNHFLGVYLGDEPGGKMLDSYTSYYNASSRKTVTKQADGSVDISFPTPNQGSAAISYNPDGTISVGKNDFDKDGATIHIDATYLTDGTIRVEVYDRWGSLLQVENDDYIPYSREELQDMYPFESYNATSEWFVNAHKSNLANMIGNYSDVVSFTSDYALYWFDYLSGYDVVLAQFGWNHSLTQVIASVRGAANLQNKDWGAIITWKYNHYPYLDNNETIYAQMRAAYEAGAKYAVIFNYAENMSGPYGTLQEDHFMALERFWNDVVQNPAVKRGSIEGEAVLVLPQNYGWGMRIPEDKIWGLWEADENSEQIWNLLSDLIQEHGFSLDIVYDNPAFPVEGKYVQTFYAPIEKTESFPTALVVAAGASVTFACLGLLFYFKKRKSLTDTRV
jgi:hypothetical protein